MALAFPIFVRTSLLIYDAAKALNDSTSAIGSSSSNIGVLQVPLVLSILVFFLPIFRPGMEQTIALYWFPKFANCTVTVLMRLF